MRECAIASVGRSRTMDCTVAPFEEGVMLIMEDVSRLHNAERCIPSIDLI